LGSEKFDHCASCQFFFKAMRQLLTHTFLLLAFSFAFWGFTPAHKAPLDLSTPQKSFEAFVEVLSQGKTEDLPAVATETGQVSLVALNEMSDYTEGMKTLGEELGHTQPEWSEITEDIYFASAKVGNKLHKMEFTKEAPGWMLYHWQIGGGADMGGQAPESAEPEE
jgi:hypothetical protein